MDKSEKKESFGKKYGLILALIAMAIVYLFPTPVDLPHAGAQTHRNSGICGYYLDDGRRFLSGQCVCHCNVYGICARHGA